MNAMYRALPEIIELPTSDASRKDLLGLHTHRHGPTLLEDRRAITRRLANFGFNIRQPRPDHWVLTHTNPLPEFHLYSGLELERFANGKAREYAKQSTKETSNELSDLSG